MFVKTKLHILLWERVPSRGQTIFETAIYLDDYAEFDR